MSEPIGFIGLGNMGLPIAQNIMKAGYELHVYNRSTEKAEPLAKEGAQVGKQPVDVVQSGGIVLSMLADDHAVESVTTGPQGILERLGPGGIHISMSTISPALAKRLTELHAQKQCSYIAAPVFGRPEAAAARQLWICLAGNQDAKERIQPILKAIGQGVFDFGEEPEKANIVKLCGNFLIVSAMEAMAEALTLAEKNGIDRSEVISMFSQTLFASPIYKNYGKMIAEQAHTPVGFQMKLGLKDIRLVTEAAMQAEMPMPLGSLLRDRLQTGVAKGRATEDWSALGLLVREDAGLQ